MTEPFAVFAVLASLVGYALVCARMFRWRPEEALLPVAAAIVILLYAFVFSGLLGTGSLAILVGGWTALALALWRARRDGREAIAGILTPGLVLFVVAALLLWLKLRHATYSQWDEFSHWALMTKFLVFAEELPKEATVVYLPQYPPGAALWHFFVTRLVPYSEGSVYFAHHLLALTALALPLRALDWGRWPTLLMVMAFGYFAAFTFGHGFQSLLVEHVLGVFFGASMLWYAAGEPTPARLVAMAAIVFTLPLWKEGGLPLAAIACTVPAVVEAIRVFDARQEGRTAAAVRRAVFAVGGVAAAAIVAHTTWSMHVERTFPTYQTKASTITASRVSSTVGGCGTEREHVVLRKFRNALFNDSVGNSRVAALSNAVFARAGLLPIIRNGDFSTKSLEGWHAFPTTDLDVFGHRLRLTRSRGPDTAAQATTSFPTQVGRRYLISSQYELRDTRSATLRVRNRQTVLAETASPEPKGQLSAEFTALSSATDLDIWLVAPTRGTYGFFDDLYVTEIASVPQERRPFPAQTPGVVSTKGEQGAVPLLANGDFSMGVEGWQPYITTRLDAVEGRLRASRSGGSDTAVQATTTMQTDVGRPYAASCDFELNNTQSATLRVRAGVETLGESTSTKPSGRLSTVFTATGRRTDVDIWFVTTLPDGHGYFDNVEVVPLDGMKAADRGILRTAALVKNGDRGVVARQEPPRSAAASGATEEVPRPRRRPWVRPIAERAASPAFWAALLTIAGVVLCCATPSECRRPIGVAAAVVTAGAIVYLLALLAVYLYGLSEQDARDLTSFGRYTGTYFFGWALVVFGLAVHVSAHRRRLPLAVALTLMLVTVATTPAASADWLLDEPHLRPERVRIRALLDKVDRDVPMDRSVSILWQQTQGFEFWILRYELAPRQTNLWNFAFGGPYYPGDVWTNNVSDAQFIDTIKPFDFLLVAHADALFWQRYGHLFDPGDRGLTSALFRIDRRADGTAALQLVRPL